MVSEPVEVDPHDDVYDELALLALSLKLALSRNVHGIDGEWEIIESRIRHFSPKKQNMIWALVSCKDPYLPRRRVESNSSLAIGKDGKLEIRNIDSAHAADVAKVHLGMLIRSSDNTNGLGGPRTFIRDSSVTIQSGDGACFIAGDVDMGDKNINKGVAGIVGRVEGDARFEGSTLTQGQTDSQTSERLSREHAAIIIALAEALASRQIDGVSLKERLSGAQHLNALAEVAESQVAPDEALNGWTAWVESLGARANGVITLLAAVTTIVTPLAQLLGFPG